MTYRPFPSVTTERVNAVSVCVAVTVTPGSTPPLSSVTRPLSSAVAWAQADVVVRRRTNATARCFGNRMILYLRVKAALDTELWKPRPLARLKPDTTLSVVSAFRRTVKIAGSVRLQADHHVTALKFAARPTPCTSLQGRDRCRRTRTRKSSR